jgi:hypothetical protein
MRWIWLFLLGPTMTTPASAQSIEDLARGDRIRVDAPGLGWKKVTATFGYRDSDSVTLAVDGSPFTVRVAPGQITKLERSLGIQTGSPWVGMAIGAVAGPALTLGALMIAGQFVESEPCTASDCDSNLGLALGLLGGSVIGGIVVGSIVATRPREKWQRVAITPVVGMGSTHHSLGVAVRISF